MRNPYTTEQARKLASGHQTYVVVESISRKVVAGPYSWRDAKRVRDEKNAQALDTVNTGEV